MSDTTPEPQPQGDPDQLGDAGKAALAAERKRANEAEKRAKEAESRIQALENQGLSDLEKATNELKAAQAEVARLTGENESQALTITRYQVGVTEGLPANLIARLQGTDEESFKADAASLRELVPSNTPSPFPKADPSQGGKPGVGKTSNADVFASQMEDAGF